MRRMKKFLLCMSISFAVLAMATEVAKAAPLKRCDIAHGVGGYNVFPWHKTGQKMLYVKLGVSETRTVFVYKECGGPNRPPVITVDKPELLKSIKPVWLDEKDPKVAYSGYRIFLSAKSAKALNQKVKVTVDTDEKVWELLVVIVPDHSTINALQEGQSDLYKRTLSNKQGVEKATSIARSAKARTRADVEISLYGFFAGETPGRPGGGMGLSANIILKRFAKDVIGLGLSPHISFMRYQLEILDLPEEGALNRDMNTTEWDFGLSFLFRWHPRSKSKVKAISDNWFYFDAKVGFTLRVEDNSDAMTWQEQNAPYQLYGINGQSDKVPVLNWGAGIFFPIFRNFAFGVSYLGTVTLTKEACVLSAMAEHNMCRKFNHSGAAEIRARF